MKNKIFYSASILTGAIVLFVLFLSSPPHAEQYDIEMVYHDFEPEISYFVKNGKTNNLELDYPDEIGTIWKIEVNGQIIDDERIFLGTDKLNINFGESIQHVTLFGSDEND